MLTEKALRDFKTWIVLKSDDSNVWVTDKISVPFEELSEVFQIALILEWFDSVGIYIEASMHNCKKFWCDVCFFETNEDFNPDYSLVDENGYQLYFDNRDSAIKRGIEKANEIYNKK